MKTDFHVCLDKVKHLQQLKKSAVVVVAVWGRGAGRRNIAKQLFADNKQGPMGDFCFENMKLLT